MQRGIKPLQTCVHSLSVYHSPPTFCRGTIPVLRSAGDGDWVGWVARGPEREWRAHRGLQEPEVRAWAEGPHRPRVVGYFGGGSPSPAGAKEMGNGEGRKQSLEKEFRV